MVPKGHAETLKTLSLDGYMVVIDTGVKGSTRQAVEDVHKLCEDPQYMSHVKHIGKLVLRASDVIEHHNFEALADIFNECHADLKALTVSHDKIEQLMKIGKRKWCDCWKTYWCWSWWKYVVLAKDLPTAKNIVKAVEKAGAAHTWIENLGG